PSPQRYDYGVQSFADAIADLFGGHQLARAHLLGHGVGGTVAIRLAAGHPELVRRLALIAPLAPPEGAPLAPRSLLAPVVGGLLLLQLLGNSRFSRIDRDKVHGGVEPADLNACCAALAPPAARSALLSTLRSSQDSRRVVADSR